MEFHPVTIYSFLLLPLFFLLILFRYKQQIAFLKHHGYLTASRKSLLLLRSSLFFLLIFLLTTVAVNLKSKTNVPVSQKVPGKNIYFLLDVSNSMKENHKLEKAKKILFRLSRKLEGDKIGLIAYSDFPYTLIPLTSDVSYFYKTLKQGAIEKIQGRGTDFRRALTELVRRFQAIDTLSHAPKIAVILSDGEHFGTDYSSRLDFLKRMDVSLIFLKLDSSKSKLDSLPQKYSQVVSFSCVPDCATKKLEKAINKQALEKIKKDENYLNISYFLLVPSLILSFLLFFLKLKK